MHSIALIIPDLFTGLSIVLTLYAVLNNVSLDTALKILIITSFLDSMDGKAARKLGSADRNPKRGKLMDSMADFINFGLFPAYLFNRSINKFSWLWILYILCLAYRLIRFYNAALPRNSATYQGVPAPFAAILLTAAIKLNITVPGLLLICILMVSTLPTIVLHRLSPKKPVLFYIVAVGAVVMSFLFQEVLFGILAAYLIHIPFAKWIERTWIKPISK